MLISLILFLFLGAISGFAAGLFGIGGGLIIVPVLLLTFTWQGFAVEVLTQMAIATSLATIVLTSISSVRTHHKHGAVDWPTVKRLSLGIVLGVILGVHTAVNLPGFVLQIGFGVFAMSVGAQMFFSITPAAGQRKAQSLEFFAAGSIIGWFSSLFGIGGGTLSVPYLHWRQFNMRQAVATSAACGLPIALIGTATNIALGMQQEQLPEWSVGYVYLPALVGIAMSSVFFATWGAQTAHKLSQSLLKKSFAAVITLIGLRFILVNI